MEMKSSALESKPFTYAVATLCTGLNRSTAQIVGIRRGGIRTHGPLVSISCQRRSFQQLQAQKGCDTANPLTQSSGPWNRRGILSFPCKYQATGDAERAIQPQSTAQVLVVAAEHGTPVVTSG